MRTYQVEIDRIYEFLTKVPNEQSTKVMGRILVRSSIQEEIENTFQK